MPDQNDMNALMADREHGMEIGEHPILERVYGEKEEFPDIFDMDKPKTDPLKKVS